MGLLRVLRNESKGKYAQVQDPKFPPGEAEINFELGNIFTLNSVAVSLTSAPACVILSVILNIN